MTVAIRGRSKMGELQKTALQTMNSEELAAGCGSACWQHEVG